MELFVNAQTAPAAVDVTATVQRIAKYNPTGRGMGAWTVLRCLGIGSLDITVVQQQHSFSTFNEARDQSRGCMSSQVRTTLRGQ